MTTFDTGNPLGSADPRDLFDNAQNTDAAVNGEGKTWVDRFGRTRVSMKGVEEAVPDAIAARNGAEVARNESVLARDASMAAAGPLYATEAEGRAAVANGQSFKVQGAGDIAAYAYRRDSAAASTLLATYPSAQAIASLNNRSTTFKSQLANGTSIAHVTGPGIYALVSTSTYPSMPEALAGKGCQLVVEAATGEGPSFYVLQRLIGHASPDTVYFRRVYVAGTPENNVADAWKKEGQSAIDSVTQSVVSLNNRSTTFKTQLANAINIAHVTGIGVYALVSTSSYTSIPEELAGKGCQLVVEAATGEGPSFYVLQRLIDHANPESLYFRRVYVAGSAENNVPSPWVKSKGAAEIDLSDLPIAERNISPGDLWSKNGSLCVRDLWGYLYTSPTTSIIGDLSKLYAFYDALVSEFPYYVSRSEIGVDQWNLPIYQYTFKPPARTMYEYSPNIGRRPKVVLTSGTHGGERGAQMGLIVFINNLCRLWRELDVYCELRWNTEFVVIPATIPSSVQDGTRRNRNGVDCNRNFNWKWGEGIHSDTDPNSQMYQGPSPASEIDVQVLQAAIPSLHGDAILIVENHNHANPEAFWVGSNSPNAMHIGLEAADKVASYLWREIVPNGDLSKSTQFITKNFEGSFAGYMEDKGIPAILIETAGVLDFAQNDGTVTSLRRVHELLLLNIVSSAVSREMRKRADNWPLA